MLDIALSAMALAIACFTLSLVIKQAQIKGNLPFILLLCCFVFLSSGSLVFAFWPASVQFYVALIPTVFFTLLPSIHLYHQGLTSDSPWRMTAKRLRHFATLPFVLFLSAAVLLLPLADFEALFFTGQGVEHTFGQMIALGYFTALCAWCLLSLYYIVRIQKDNFAYRKKLKRVFSDEQGKDLKWISVVPVLLVVIWLYALAVLLLEERVEQYGIVEEGVYALLLILVWITAGFGLHQKAPLAAVEAGAIMPLENEADKEQDSVVEDETQTDGAAVQYQRSALSQDDRIRIATKLQQAINRDHVYLEAELSLPRLSTLTGVSNHYISQTLSQELNTTFFDFINKARIEHAKNLLIETDDSVLDIALATGFNARSSFYKAFKLYTQATPSQYRKSAQRHSA